LYFDAKEETGEMAHERKSFRKPINKIEYDAFEEHRKNRLLEQKESRQSKFQIVRSSDKTSPLRPTIETTIVYAWQDGLNRKTDTSWTMAQIEPMVKFFTETYGFAEDMNLDYRSKYKKDSKCKILYSIRCITQFCNQQTQSQPAFATLVLSQNMDSFCRSGFPVRLLSSLRMILYEDWKTDQAVTSAVRDFLSSILMNTKQAQFHQFMLRHFGDLIKDLIFSENGHDAGLFVLSHLLVHITNKILI
jgi:hypothetical protein